MIPIDPIPIIQYLDLIHEFRYIIYLHIIDIEGSIQYHYRKEYRGPKTPSQRDIRLDMDSSFPLFLFINLDSVEKYWEPLLIQSWTPGQAKKYFAIFESPSQSNDPLQNDPPSLDDTINDLLQRVNLQDEQNEATLLLTRNQILNTQARGQNSPWLTRIKWKIILIFKG
jgi:hypothetical protein